MAMDDPVRFPSTILHTGNIFQLVFAIQWYCDSCSHDTMRRTWLRNRKLTLNAFNYLHGKKKKEQIEGKQMEF